MTFKPGDYILHFRLDKDGTPVYQIIAFDGELYTVRHKNGETTRLTKKYIEDAYTKFTKLAQLLKECNDEN